MLKDILKTYIDNNNLKGFIVKLRYNEDLKNELIKETDFLPNNVSISERVWYLKNNLTEIQKCPYCENKRKFQKLNKGLFATCGNDICKKKALSVVGKKPRNWVSIQEKMHATYKAKTGYEHNMQNPEFLKKLKHFNIETEAAKQGAKKFLKEHPDFISNNIIAKYGSLSACANLCVKKRIDTLIKNEFQKIIDKLSDFNFTYIPNNGNNFTVQCNKCKTIIHLTRQGINYNYRNKRRFCPKCDYKNMTFRSNFEKDIADEIKNFYNGEMQFNRYIGKHECDIIIPEKKIAIEANGCYWHTEIYKDKLNHQQKKKDVENEGYNLIQIWDDDWNDIQKKKIIISRLKCKLGFAEKIYARKCEIKEVSGNASKIFLNENHLQGYIPATYKLGLYFKNELVEIVTLGKTRKLIGNKNNCLELYRLCSKQNTEIIGGFSKLLKHFQKLYNKENLKIISYSDCDWCKLSDNGYEKSGFNLIKITAPDYYWLVDNIRKNRLNFTKKKLGVSNKTETEIMHDNGYQRIWGSGNILFEIKNIS